MLDHSAADWVEPDRYEINPTAQRFEQWERSYAPFSGSGRPQTKPWPSDSTRSPSGSRTPAEHLRERLTDEIPGATVRDLGQNRCGIVTFSLDGAELSTVSAQLRRAGINVSIVPPASALIDTRKRNLPPMIRASVHYYNTDDEIDRLITELRSAG